MPELDDADDNAGDSTLIPYVQIVDPPNPADLGSFLSAFGCWLTRAAFDHKTGRLNLTLSVDVADKYAAMPLTDVAGKRFTVMVYAPKEWDPVVEAGVLRVTKVASARKAKAAVRAKARAWRRVRAAYVGWDGPTELTDDE